jgi:nucleoside-diphosphate-sugar epimerase
MKVILTGASGFIGKKLIKYNQGKRDLLALTRSDIEKCEFLKFNSLFDVTSADLNDAQTFVHLAGLAHGNNITKYNYQRFNTELTLFLANKAVEAGIKRFVFISSIGVNGSSSGLTPFNEKSAACPLNEYSKSKYEAELGLYDIAKKTGLEIVIIRPTLVYGSGAPGNFGLLTTLIQKTPILPFGLVDNSRSFIAVQNLIDLIFTCINHPKAVGQTFLASDGKVESTKSFTNAIAKSLNRKVIQLPVPIIFMKAAAYLLRKTAMVGQLVDNLEVENKHLNDLLGWTAPYTIHEAMKKD